MSYPVRIEGPLTGIVRVYRKVDITRVHDRPDGFCAGLDLHLCLKVVNHAGVQFLVTRDGKKGDHIVTVYPHGYLTELDHRLTDEDRLVFDLKDMSGFGRYDLSLEVVYQDGDLHVFANLTPRYMPRMRFDAELHVTSYTPLPDVRRWRRYGG